MFHGDIRMSYWGVALFRCFFFFLLSKNVTAVAIAELFGGGVGGVDIAPLLVGVTVFPGCDLFAGVFSK